LFAAALVMPQIAFSQVVDDEFVMYSFPQGWVVDQLVSFT